jgi:hypothetical protein
MLGNLTVRSDVFVVYGYMEAVRVHPLNTGYAGLIPLQQVGEWYGNSVTDDPQATGASLLRTGRKRFVAIIDRSWCNYRRDNPNNLFVLPKVLAYRELPY